MQEFGFEQENFQLFQKVVHHLVNDLSDGVHHDRPQSDEDLPRVVEEDDVLGGGDVGDVDVAGHEADGHASEDPGHDEGDDVVGGEAHDDPAEDVGQRGQDQHGPGANYLLEETSKDSDDDLSVVFGSACVLR